MLYFDGENNIIVRCYHSNDENDTMTKIVIPMAKIQYNNIIHSRKNKPEIAIRVCMLDQLDFPNLTNVKKPAITGRSF